MIPFRIQDFAKKFNVRIQRMQADASSSSYKQSDITITQYKAILAKNSMVSYLSLSFSSCFVELTSRLFVGSNRTSATHVETKWQDQRLRYLSTSLLLYTVLSSFCVSSLVTITSFVPSLSHSLTFATRRIVHYITPLYTSLDPLLVRLPLHCCYRPGFLSDSFAHLMLLQEADLSLAVLPVSLFNAFTRMIHGSSPSESLDSVRQSMAPEIRNFSRFVELNRLGDSPRTRKGLLISRETFQR